MWIILYEKLVVLMQFHVFFWSSMCADTCICVPVTVLCFLCDVIFSDVVFYLFWSKWRCWWPNSLPVVGSEILGFCYRLTGPIAHSLYIIMCIIIYHAGPIYNGSERKSNSLNVKTKSEFRADFFYISNIRLKILDLN